MKDLKTSRIALVALLIGASAGMAACEKKETPVEKATDAVGDALNVREHEKLKDAAEDAKDAVTNAAEGVKEEVQDATKE